MLFHERKRLASYRSVAVLVNDQELGCVRVTAFHSNIPDAKTLAARCPHWQKAEVFVRVDPEPEPITGDYQI